MASPSSCLAAYRRCLDDIPTKKKTTSRTWREPEQERGRQAVAPLLSLVNGSRRFTSTSLATGEPSTPAAKRELEKAARRAEPLGYPQHASVDVLALVSVVQARATEDKRWEVEEEREGVDRSRYTFERGSAKEEITLTHRT